MFGVTEARTDIHLTPEEIQAFIEGTLDRRHQERMLEHLDHCRMCVKLLADATREKRSARLKLARTPSR